jgi:SAM-dependent methyltransferase
MNQQVDFEAVKQVQRMVWSDGDFSKVATGVVIVGELLCEAVDVRPGERVLDVACGSGNTALAAARRFAATVGLDYVPGLLERGRERAAAEGLEIEFVEGDAEALPFEEASFDVVLSTFGAMFAPNQPRTAAELLRVCRPGGRIGMANWTPEGAVGQIFRITAQHAPPPFPLDPPMLWGTEERLRELLGDGISALSAPRREVVFRYPSPEFWVEYFRTWFGPTKAAFARLDEAGQEAYANDLLALWRSVNRAGDQALVAPSEYLEVVATRA